MASRDRESPTGQISSKSPARIAGMFDAIADRYDLLNHLLSAGIDRRWRRRAIRSLALTGRERVLDLCTGTADVAIGARPARGRRPRAWSAWISPGAMLRVGHGKIRTRAADRSHHAGARRRDPPPARRRVRRCRHDRPSAFATSGPGGGLPEMRRVLRPGGRLAILEFGDAARRPAFGRCICGTSITSCRGSAGSCRVTTRRTGICRRRSARSPSPDEFVTILRQSGFVDVSRRPSDARHRLSVHGRRG